MTKEDRHFRDHQEASESRRPFYPQTRPPHPLPAVFEVQQDAEPGKVPSNVCAGTKLKTCLVMLGILGILAILGCQVFIHLSASKDVTAPQLDEMMKLVKKRSAPQLEMIEEVKNQVVLQLEEMISKEVKKQAVIYLEEIIKHVEKKSQPQVEEMIKEMKKYAELKRIQLYAVDVTLDPETANPRLILTDDGKQVYHSDVRKNLPDNPKRFYPINNVLGKQSFSSGRFYFEVQVKGKTAWDLGVVRESITRKGRITLSPENGFWTIWLRNGNEYSGNDDRPVRLSLQSGPQKVGVFVDYEEGLVSFYDVDAAALIYSFTGCSFTETLYPFFSPANNAGGKNSAPLIISPVN